MEIPVEVSSKSRGDGISTAPTTCPGSQGMLQAKSKPGSSLLLIPDARLQTHRGYILPGLKRPEYEGCIVQERTRPAKAPRSGSSAATMPWNQPCAELRCAADCDLVQRREVEGGTSSPSHTMPPIASPARVNYHSRPLEEYETVACHIHTSHWELSLGLGTGAPIRRAASRQIDWTRTASR
jgi:hypothetical protein